MRRIKFNNKEGKQCKFHEHGKGGKIILQPGNSEETGLSIWKEKEIYWINS